ncbi:hypothetical protein [Rubrivirga sp. IMCC45206]|uniref:hypothetical protein n=1 Tax=Rubrivirga sp. IMCC45206 TaxID=3391614 RepID=UPI00398FA1EF
MPTFLDRLETLGDQAEDLAARFNEGVVDTVEGLAWWTDRSAVRPLRAVGRALGALVHVLFGVLRVAVFYVPAVALGIGGAAAGNVWLVATACVYAVAVTGAGLTYIARQRTETETEA